VTGVQTCALPISNLSSAIAFNHASFLPGLSNETPNMVNPFSLYLLKAATKFGFSWRHGPHHDAQKSTSTYFPLNDDKASWLPAVSGKEKSGAIAPTATVFKLAILSAKDLPLSLD